MWKSRSAGLNAKVRSALIRRHPVTGDIIETVPAVRAEFGFPTGVASTVDPATGVRETLEGYQGGFFDLDSVAEERGWDDDVKAMVERRLDELCQQMPNVIQSVDYVTAPAQVPWPTYDAEDDGQKVFDLAVALGLATRALEYERENRRRPSLIQALEAHLALSPEPEPAPEPVLAVDAPQAEEPLLRIEGLGAPDKRVVTV
jgi:hypothetical protein